MLVANNKTAGIDTAVKFNMKVTYSGKKVIL